MIDPARAIGLGPVGLLGDHLAQRAGLHTGRPHLAGTFDATLGAVLALHRDALIVHVGHHRVELDLDAHLLQPPLRLQPQFLAHRRQHRAGALEQNHPAFVGLDGAKRAGQRAIGELGDLACQLDAGRSRADHDEGQPALALSVIGGDLRGLERPEYPAAKFQRVVDGLHAGGEGRELVVAEIGLLCARGHDEAVEMRHGRHRHQLAR